MWCDNRARGHREWPGTSGRARNFRCSFAGIRTRFLRGKSRSLDSRPRATLAAPPNASAFTLVPDLDADQLGLPRAMESTPFPTRVMSYALITVACRPEGRRQQRSGTGRDGRRPAIFPSLPGLERAGPAHEMHPRIGC